MEHTEIVEEAWTEWTQSVENHIPDCKHYFESGFKYAHDNHPDTEKLLKLADRMSDLILGGERGWESMDFNAFVDVCANAVASSRQITAKMENWEIIIDPVGASCYVHGEIYNDRRNRFPDGHVVDTSAITNLRPFEKGDIVETRNSVYLLGNPSTQ